MWSLTDRLGMCMVSKSAFEALAKKLREHAESNELSRAEMTVRDSSAVMAKSIQALK